MKRRSRRPRSAAGSAAPRTARSDRKVRQLCGQVAQTLDQVLAEREEGLLRDLQVLTVEPVQGSTHLLVTVRSLHGGASPSAIMGRLAEVSGELRTEIAGAITRRRVPTLAFRVVPPGASPLEPSAP